MKQMEAWQSYDLTTKGLKDYTMYLPTLTLASTFFFTENYHNDSTGWLIGEDSAYGLPIFFDPFYLTKNRTSHNMGVIGTSGSGKSYLLKLLAINEYARGTKLFLFDIENELQKLCERCGGEHIDLSSKSLINPLQVRYIMTDEDEETSILGKHLGFLENFFSTAFEDITEKELVVLLDIVEKFYNERGITKKTTIEEYEKMTPKDYPIFSDLYAYLLERQKSCNNKDLLKILVNIEVLLKRMVIGQDANLFNGITTIDLNNNLIVTSEDELADLSLSFNLTQSFTKNNVNQLKSNQSMLMERERLASLGQLIGGIAHNLKTPIMSISGAAEGLSDLVKEYDSSIDDPDVNSQDHHDIAKDMNSWIVKIKDYTEYMSDIITTVKGQAVNLSNEEDISFTIEELLKRVNILMKHELKNAIIYLNISLKTDENTIIHGDVNSLVQVINNMVSNSIQAYEGKTEQTIDLIVEKEDNNLLISIKDYASGLPDKVKEKLFKEMITTKGKNGTGLGLYMSYSTIKAHFNGNITVDSELGKGTTFTITLPLQ